MPDKPDHDKSKVDEEKVKKALKAAGVVIPDDPHLRQKFSAELSKQGHPTPSVTLLANGHYCLVVED